MSGFFLSLFALHVLAFASMELARPDVRDPEYGKRIDRLKARVAENPTRAVVVVLGSSRAAMGVRPQVWETATHETPTPLLFNMARVGAGPLFELMTLRRLVADGVTPDVVVIEYWPPLMDESGAFNELDRVEAGRLYRSDTPFIREYLPDARRIERTMLGVRLNPLHAYRQRWLAELAPSWVPSARRVEPGCRGMDAWGWVPGLDNDPALRPARLAHFEPIYREHFRRFRISPVADRAVRECVAFAHANGARVAFAFLPESSEFRRWYTLETERTARDHLAGMCRDLDVPLIDSRLWLPDDSFADGFHLSPSGASAFTRLLGAAVAELGWHAPQALR